MDIDVINTLNDVLVICKNITISDYFNSIQESIEDIVIYDLCNFIKHISVKQGAERVLEFLSSFLSTKQIKQIKVYSPIESISYPLFAVVDSHNQTSYSKKVSELFYVVGRYYLLDRKHKKDINFDLFKDFMNEINNFVVTRSCFTNKKEHSKTINRLVEDKAILNSNKNEIKQNKEKNLQELLNELNSLIGLEKVKAEVKKRINQIQVDKRREQAGYKKSTMSLHLVFTGNPGTGKTTVARKLAEIYQKLGVLSQGHFVEVDRSKLVGAYVGSTAIKTQEVIDKAIGGILFIDEAYTLSQSNASNDFGQEAIDTLLKAMEDKRDDFIVIVAGYTKQMEQFIKSNPGLESRFNKYIEFDDYSSDELYRIFKLICENDQKILHEECDDYLKKYFEEMIQNKPVNFANGRTVRNYYESVIENLNDRLAEKLDSVSDEELQLIRLTDLVI